MSSWRFVGIHGFPKNVCCFSKVPDDLYCDRRGCTWPSSCPSTAALCDWFGCFLVENSFKMGKRTREREEKDRADGGEENEREVNALQLPEKLQLLSTRIPPRHIVERSSVWQNKNHRL